MPNELTDVMAYLADRVAKYNAANPRWPLQSVHPPSTGGVAAYHQAIFPTAHLELLVRRDGAMVFESTFKASESADVEVSPAFEIRELTSSVSERFVTHDGKRFSSVIEGISGPLDAFFARVQRDGRRAVAPESPPVLRNRRECPRCGLMMTSEIIPDGFDPSPESYTLKETCPAHGSTYKTLTPREKLELTQRDPPQPTR